MSRGGTWVGEVIIPPQTLFEGGYTVFTLSVRVCVRACVRPCVRPSVRNVLFP